MHDLNICLDHACTAVPDDEGLNLISSRDGRSIVLLDLREGDRL